MNKNVILLSVLLLTLSVDAFAQNKLLSRVNFDVGIIGRTTILYHHGTRGLSSGPLLIHDVAYSYKAGVNGTGVNFSLGYNLWPTEKLILQASSTIRYDHFFLYNKTTYFDASLNLTKSVLKKYYIGAGATIYNINKELTYSVNHENKTLPLEFNSIDLFIGVPFWVIFIEPKLSIVQSNFPGPIKDNATLLGLRLFYRFSSDPENANQSIASN